MVLNGVDDGFRRLLRDRVRGVIVVDLDVNRGFAGGCAAGRTAASGEYLALLHDDAVAAPDWLGALIACSGERCNAAGDRASSSGREAPIDRSVLWRDGATTQIAYGEPDEPERHDRRRVVDYGSSSSLLVRTEAWDAAGGPRPEPLSRLLRRSRLGHGSPGRLGTTVMYEPGARTTHHQGTTPLWRSAMSPSHGTEHASCTSGETNWLTRRSRPSGVTLKRQREPSRELSLVQARARGATPLGRLGSPVAPPELLSDDAFILMQQRARSFERLSRATPSGTGGASAP